MKMGGEWAIKISPVVASNLQDGKYISDSSSGSEWVLFNRFDKNKPGKNMEGIVKYFLLF